MLSPAPHQPRTARPTHFLTLALLTLVACGGGGGSDDGTSNNVPSPAPSRIPVDPPVTNPRNPSTARIALENGDRAIDGFVVGNIEDAALAADGSLALIAAAEQGDQRAVLRLDEEGTLRTIFDETNAPDGIDLTTLTRLRMAPTGEIVFQSGAGLDTDQLHLALEDDVQTIAGLEGATAPDFRILGDVRIAEDGLVAFVGGGGECEVDTGSGTPRDLCTLALFFSDGRDIVRIEDEEFELDRRPANDVEIAMNGAGDLFFSVPGRRTSPVVVRFDGSEPHAVLRNADELPGFGILSRVDVVDLDQEGRLLVELGVQPENSDDPVRDRVGLLDGDQLTSFAVEGGAEGDRTVSALRGIGLGGGRALFEATLLDGASEQETRCLRLGDATSTVEIACEGDPFPGEESEVFSIGGTRINSVGDVLFVTTLGTRGEGTTRVQERRASVRRASGEMVTIASSLDNETLGRVTRFTTVGFTDVGQALLIAERSRSSDRLLLLGDSR